MFGNRLTLFELLGFKIQVDFSWVFLAILVTWSLAAGLFPSYYPGLEPRIYWYMGIAGAAGLFGSIILHELAHSVVARRYGIPIRSITLFVFGGVAEMEEEPPNALSELLMALAGPAASAVLALIFWIVSAIVQAVDLPVTIYGILSYLATINGILALFNLIPAFPLDGGRALRAILWHLKGDLRQATHTASKTGAVFGTALIFLGVFSILRGNFIGGMWWCVIGLFVRAAAAASYRQVLTKRMLKGEPVFRFMTAEPFTVAPTIDLAEFVEEHVYRHHHEFFPVVEGDRLVGYVTTREVKTIHHADWPDTLVRDLMQPIGPDNTVGPETEAVDALALMNRTGNSRLMVAKNDHLMGIITLKDLLKLIALKMDLEGEEE